MSWWKAFTSEGRSLTTVVVEYKGGGLSFRVYGLKEGESVVCAYDRLAHRVYLNAPFEECKRVVLLHNYELTDHTPTTLTERINGLVHDELWFEELELTATQ